MVLNLNTMAKLSLSTSSPIQSCSGVSIAFNACACGADDLNHGVSSCCCVQ